MFGLMQDTPLLISSILTHAARHHKDAGIVTKTVEGDIHRYSYEDAEKRAKQLANAIKRLGVDMGDRVGTLAWNTYRHFEIYYAVAGIGSVIHTVNPRLYPDQLDYIINHAEDKLIFVDLNIVPLLEPLIEKLKTVQGVVIMTDEARMPETSLSETTKVYCYETIVAAESDDLHWPEFDERMAACLCYTSGTTGNPKGVLYSHRSTLLHAMACNGTDVLGLRSSDRALPVVPMFHVNAWGVPYAAPMVGATIVFPGPHLDGKSLQNLMEDEGVTFSAGVPTIWLGLLNYLKESGRKLETLNRTVIGGSACPRTMIETFDRDYGVTVDHAWGMTEMSPLGTYNAPKGGMADFTDTQRYDVAMKQGRAIFGVDMKIVDDDGKLLPHDGEAFGTLYVRGHWVCTNYFRNEGMDTHDAQGWFNTGDVATIDPLGYMGITDRTKDVIKSGGEWISSIDLENIAVGHPKIAEAAAIAAYHPKWDERPLLVVVRAPSAPDLTKEEVLAFFDGKIANWWMPDDVAFVDELPHTATGKIQKLKLREQFEGYKLPTI